MIVFIIFRMHHVLFLGKACFTNGLAYSKFQQFFLLFLLTLALALALSLALSLALALALSLALALALTCLSL